MDSLLALGCFECSNTQQRLTHYKLTSSGDRLSSQTYRASWSAEYLRYHLNMPIVEGTGDSHWQTSHWWHL